MLDRSQDGDPILPVFKAFAQTVTPWRKWGSFHARAVLACFAMETEKVA